MADDPAVYELLREQVERSRGTRDLQTWIDVDIAFHRMLLDASGLAPLVAFNDLLQIFFQRFREGITKAEWLGGIESHRRIVDALRDQNVPGASDELRRHIESHRNRLGART